MFESATSPHRWARLIRAASLVALCGAAWCLRAGFDSDGAVAAGMPSWILDSDHDGLTDAHETYLSTASTNPALQANPFNADTDGDGQPDGFEFCLSGGTSVVSPGVTHLAEPKLAIASYQDGSSLVLSFLLMASDVSLIEDFKIFASTLVNGKPILLDVTAVWLKNIHSVGVAVHGPHALFAFEATAPISLIEASESLGIAAVAKVAGTTIGEAATYTTANGIAYRWRSLPALGSAQAQANDQQQAEPQTDSIAPGATANQVCGAQAVIEPSGIDGVLTSVVVSVGCQGGTWSCPGSVCSMTGPAGRPKVILDVDLLLD
jgi:hypothetical protein